VCRLGQAQRGVGIDGDCQAEAALQPFQALAGGHREHPRVGREIAGPALVGLDDVDAVAGAQLSTDRVSGVDGHAHGALAVGCGASGHVRGPQRLAGLDAPGGH
jgi:hypothetical protein